jgi:hypothetical protein
MSEFDSDISKIRKIESTTDVIAHMLVDKFINAMITPITKVIVEKWRFSPRVALQFELRPKQ